MGDFITCNINFGGRKWTDKTTGEVKGTFFSLKGWKLEKANESQQFQNNAHPQHQAPVHTPPPHSEKASQVNQGADPTQAPNFDDINDPEDCPF